VRIYHHLVIDDPFAAAERFVQAEARVLEQRMFAHLFRGAPSAGVADALRGYRNADGGFGHGLEPDKRTPDSLPVDVEVAFQNLALSDHPDPELLRPACDFLDRVAQPDGSVALAAPVIEAYPRAGHWSEWTYRPGLNPTAGLCGQLHRLGYAHPWRDRATAYCWLALESGDLPDEVHELSECLVFLEYVPDRDRADKIAGEVVDRMLGQQMFHLDPATPGYGLSPLQIAPVPAARWRPLFTDAQIEGHLDHLLATQGWDGGFPINWAPPSAASSLEWRGAVTVPAIRTLTAYGRITRP
jgi:hypothetical protein